MVAVPRQGEIWWAEAEDKRRPVLVCLRDAVIPMLKTVVVAPVTRTVRGIPTEVPLSKREGLRTDCAATFDNLQSLRRGYFISRIGALDPLRHQEVCAALRAMSDC